MSVSTNAGANRMSGIWGSAWDSAGNLISEAVQVDAPVELARINVPIVGTMREAHKRGRETREGTMRVQKIDSKWELQVYNLLSQSVQARRDMRDGKIPRFDPEFTLILKLDDPDALGVERWQLNSCLIWRLPLGFNIADELLEKEYPFTWESEQPLTAFLTNSGSGTPTAQYTVGAAP